MTEANVFKKGLYKEDEVKQKKYPEFWAQDIGVQEA